MNIRINEDPACGKPEIVIRCREVDKRVVRMIAALCAAEHKLAGIREGRTFVVGPAEVNYAESVDKRTYAVVLAGAFLFGWAPRPTVITVLAATGIFLAAYAVPWLFFYFYYRAQKELLNEKLESYKNA